MARNKGKYNDRADHKRNKLNKALGRTLSEAYQTSNKSCAGAVFPCIPTQNVGSTRARGTALDTRRHLGAPCADPW